MIIPVSSKPIIITQRHAQMAALFAAKRKRAEKKAQTARVDFDELAQLTNDKRKRMPDESEPEVSLLLQHDCAGALTLCLPLSHSDSPCSLSECGAFHSHSLALTRSPSLARTN